MKEIFIEVDGKKISALVEDKEWQKLVQPVKKTGYEVVKEKECYWTINSANKVMFKTEANREYDREVCDNANYYSDKTVAENNARADKLMRQLRKFAVEHREKELDWKDDCQNKYQIVFDHDENNLGIERHQFMHYCSIHFDSYKTAQLAINTFKDELLWYFTEYKDSL